MSTVLNLRGRWTARRVRRHLADLCADVAAHARRELGLGLERPLVLSVEVLAPISGGRGRPRRAAAALIARVVY